MKIVHYSLGLPPFRTGGMTKFVLDLMIHQRNNNHSVYLLWPGEFSVFYRNTRIEECKEHNGIKNYRIINGNPIPYDEGIIDVNKFINDGSLNSYLDFFDLIKPDVLHIHTFLGLQKNLVIAAKTKNIRVVFSSHDFYPLCAKLNMFRNDSVCDCVDKLTHCPECNLTAFSVYKLMLLQSKSYRLFKDINIIRSMRKKHRNYFLNEKSDNKNVKPINTVEDYRKLRRYFFSLLDHIDMIHYNSTLSKSIYEKYIGYKDNVVINLSHLNIKDNKKKKTFGNKLRITYLGNQSQGKGYYYLIRSLDELCKTKQIELKITFDPDDNRSYIRTIGSYDYDQLEEIYNETDVLVVPSLFYDTFGFVVLEAISYGTPVIISNNVGAIDIINNHAGVVFNVNDKDNLYRILSDLSVDKLEAMNDYICSSIKVLTIDKVEKNIMEKCYLSY